MSAATAGFSAARWNFSLFANTVSTCAKSNGNTIRNTVKCGSAQRAHSNITHLSFAQHDQEFHQEAHVVARMEAMPHGQEDQRPGLTVITIAQELQSLENILGHPVIGLHVEAVDVMLESFGILEHQEFNIRAAVPLSRSVGASARIGKTCITVNMVFIVTKGEIGVKMRALPKHVADPSVSSQHAMYLYSVMRPHRPRMNQRANMLWRAVKSSEMR